MTKPGNPNQAAAKANNAERIRIFLRSNVAATRAQIVAHTGLNPATVSRHLKAIREASKNG